jgi:hypothetical protein
VGAVAVESMIRPLVGAVYAALVAATLGAQQPTAAPDSAKNPHAVQPERPTVATHAGTVAPGWLEVEAGVEFDRFGSSHSSFASFTTPIVLKFGLADRVQLGVFGSVTAPVGGSRGIGDGGFGVKWRLLDDAPVVGDFAILPSIKLPTGSFSSGTGTGTTDGSLLLISSHDFGGVAMDINVGYTRRGGDGLQAPTSSTVWTLSFGGPFTSQVGWVAELYGFPGTSAAPPIVALLTGPTFSPREWLAFDVGVIIPVDGPQPHALYAGTVFNVGQLWGKRR